MIHNSAAKVQSLWTLRNSSARGAWARSGAQVNPLEGRRGHKRLFLSRRPGLRRYSFEPGTQPSGTVSLEFGARSQSARQDGRGGTTSSR
jgi:hypothetical protein